MIHISRSPHGGLALGIGVARRAVWAQRQPYSVFAEADPPQVGIRHRWRFWRTSPSGGLPEAGNGASSAGVREPRRPLPGGISDAAALEPPVE